MMMVWPARVCSSFAVGWVAARGKEGGLYHVDLADGTHARVWGSDWGTATQMVLASDSIFIVDGCAEWHWMARTLVSAPTIGGTRPTCTQLAARCVLVHHLRHGVWLPRRWPAVLCRPCRRWLRARWQRVGNGNWQVAVDAVGFTALTLRG